MDRIFLTLAAALVLVLITAPGDAQARRESVKCTPEAAKQISLAVNFLNQNIEKLKNPGFDLGKRRVQTRMIKRRIGRKLDKMRYNCAETRHCAAGNTTNGRNATGIFGHKVHLCYNTMANNPGKNKFCFFVGVIAHEFGHSVGIPKDGSNHGVNKNDRVYQFGHFARDLCQDAGLDRPLDVRAFIRNILDNL